MTLANASSAFYVRDTREGCGVNNAPSLLCASVHSAEVCDLC